MSRFFLGLLAVFALMALFLSGLEVLTIEGRPGATVFQQIVATTKFGFSVLAFILALGFYAVIGAIERGPAGNADQLKVSKEIAVAVAATQAILEAPVKKAEAEAAERGAAEKKARYAAYREELAQGTKSSALDRLAADPPRLSSNV